MKELIMNGGVDERNGRMNEGRNGWMNGRVNERNGRMNRGVDERNGRMNEGLDERVNGWMIEG